MDTHTLTLSLVERQVRIQCRDRQSQALIETTYGGLRCAATGADLHYTLMARNDPPEFILRRPQHPVMLAHDESECLAIFEDQLALDLQRQRPDLYFLHAAVLAYEDAAFMLLAPSGGGKSTTTWALITEGCRYLSDEFGPVDLSTLAVHAYPRALCLKAVPPAAYPLPSQTLVTATTLHVPTMAFPAPPIVRPLPLIALFFLDYHPARPPQIAPMSAADASQRLFTQALNPLAHPADGLEAAITIVRHTACFHLISSDLWTTCQQVQAQLARLLSITPRETRAGQ